MAQAQENELPASLRERFLSSDKTLVIWCRQMARNHPQSRNWYLAMAKEVDKRIRSYERARSKAA